MGRLALILDFDGVIADSEPLSNVVTADLLTELGSSTTAAECQARYLGKRIADMATMVEARHGITLPDDFEARLIDATIKRFLAELAPIPGVKAFLETHRQTPKAVASSSPMRQLRACIARFGLEAELGAHVYSAEMVPNGKPAPDLFLHAASAIGADPADCVVVEDSPTGVQAGVAAGMRVIGLLAGGHIQPGHGDRLRAAGAWRIANDYASVEAALAQMSGSGA